MLSLSLVTLLCVCRGRRNAGEMKGVTMEENKKHLAALRQLLARPENKACADCKSSTAGGPPSWASINTGAFICMSCAGIHRGLGVHVSKVCRPASPHLPMPHMSAGASACAGLLEGSLLCTPAQQMVEVSVSGEGQSSRAEA